MKKYLLSLLFMFSLTGCKRPETAKLQVIEDNVEKTIGKKRIKFIGYYRGVHLLEIDGHFYASYYKGGLTHLESCRCKKYEKIQEK